MRNPVPTVFPPPFPLPPDWRWAPSVTDPGHACDEACQRRHQQAYDMSRVPHPDREARRWREHDERLTRLILRWFEKSPPDDAAVARWFGSRPLELRYPSEPYVIMEWSVLGYRSVPHAPTAAERLLSGSRLSHPDVAQLARAAVAAPVTLLRVVAADPQTGMDLEPLCPPGPVVRVPDRSSACLAHEGSLVGGRVLPAGSWHLLRPVGPMVSPAGARPLLLALDRALGRRGTARERSEAVLRAEPELLSDLLATYAPLPGA